MKEPENFNDFLTRIASQYAPVSNIFIMRALRDFSEEVLEINDDDPQWNRSLITLQLWKEIAKFNIKELDKREEELQKN